MKAVLNIILGPHDTVWRVEGAYFRSLSCFCRSTESTECFVYHVWGEVAMGCPAWKP